MIRMGFVIGIRPEAIPEYKRLHAAVWPDVAAKIAECHIRNYTIYLREPENLLFASYDYHGAHHDADMAMMAADPVTQDWWRVCMPLQVPLETRAEGEWWAPLEEVFHQD
ncbi:L-rhamnose mutarotase [Mangrovicella endophytica]|uniref:L-rhamnose mutarotase n=1 Tax=Mangrovicella endophytica TaxID=2066697 RepID=UPI000C9E37E8|nr:L-rhamnose mutarotase [Mangrovicella endophytica]